MLGGVHQLRGTFFFSEGGGGGGGGGGLGPHNKEYKLLGSVLGSPHFWFWK